METRSRVTADSTAGYTYRDRLNRVVFGYKSRTLGSAWDVCDAVRTPLLLDLVESVSAIRQGHVSWSGMDAKAQAVVQVTSCRREQPPLDLHGHLSSSAQQS